MAMFKLHPNVSKGMDARIIDADSGETFGVPYDRKDAIVRAEGVLGFSQDGGLGTVTPGGSFSVAVFDSAEVASDGMSVDVVLTGSVDAVGDDFQSGFLVKADGIEMAILSADNDDETVTLNLDVGIQEDQEVSVSYFASNGKLTDGYAQVKSFVRESATNSSTAVLPELVSAATDVDGTSVILAFSENMESGSPVEGFTILVDDVEADVSDVTITDDEVVFVIDGITDESVIVASYDAEAGSLRSVATHLPAGSITDEAVTNNTVAPAFASAEIGAVDDETLVITFSKPVTSPGEDFLAGITVEIGGSPVTFTDPGNTDGTTVSLTLDAPAENGDVVTVSYDADDGDLQSATGSLVASFTDQAVTNTVAP